jgi:AcrR family transcriptional regulator
MEALGSNERSFYLWSMTRKAETREAILDHAVRIASEVGLEGLTIGRLASALDLSKSGLFAHFGSKDALQVEVLERAAARFVEVVVRPALAAPRGEARLRALFERWLRWPREVPQPGGCIFVQAAAELDDRPGAARDRLVALERDWLATIARVVRGAQAEGQLRSDLDPEQVAFELHAVMLGWHHASRLLRDRSAVERARRSLDRLIDSARPPRA